MSGSAPPLSGMARDILRVVASSKNATWNLNGGKLNVVHTKAADAKPADTTTPAFRPRMSPLLAVELSKALDA